jgi:hypothetical protein
VFDPASLTGPPTRVPPPPAAVDRGSCRATHRVAVDGARVGFLYRESPRHPGDSGWRLLAGDESDDYLDDPAHTGEYDLQLLADFDPAVLPLLDEPHGSAFRWDARDGRFVAVVISPW